MPLARIRLERALGRCAMRSAARPPRCGTHDHEVGSVERGRWCVSVRVARVAHRGAAAGARRLPAGSLRRHTLKCTSIHSKWVLQNQAFIRTSHPSSHTDRAHRSPYPHTSHRLDIYSRTSTIVHTAIDLGSRDGRSHPILPGSSVRVPRLEPDHIAQVEHGPLPSHLALQAELSAPQAACTLIPSTLAVERLAATPQPLRAAWEMLVPAACTDGPASSPARPRALSPQS